MVSGDFLFTMADNPAFPFWSENDPIDRLSKLFESDGFLVLTSRENRGFVNEVRKIGPCESCGFLRDYLQVDIFIQRFSLTVDFEYSLSASDIRWIEYYSACLLYTSPSPRD